MSTATLFELPAVTVPADFVSAGHRAVLVSLFASCQRQYLLHWLHFFRTRPTTNREDMLAALLCVELLEAELQSRGEVAHG